MLPEKSLFFRHDIAGTVLSEFQMNMVLGPKDDCDHVEHEADNMNAGAERAIAQLPARIGSDVPQALRDPLKLVHRQIVEEALNAPGQGRAPNDGLI